VAYYYAPTPWGPWSTVDASSQTSLIFSQQRDTPGDPDFNAYGPYRVLRYGAWNRWTRLRTMFYTLSQLNTRGPYSAYLSSTVFKPAS
jgi:hypothetical protein